MALGWFRFLNPVTASENLHCFQGPAAAASAPFTLLPLPFNLSPTVWLPVNWHIPRLSSSLVPTFTPKTNARYIGSFTSAPRTPRSRPGLTTEPIWLVVLIHLLLRMHRRASTTVLPRGCLRSHPSAFGVPLLQPWLLFSSAPALVVLLAVLALLKQETETNNKGTKTRLPPVLREERKAFFQYRLGIRLRGWTGELRKLCDMNIMYKTRVKGEVTVGAVRVVEEGAADYEIWGR